MMELGHLPRRGEVVKVDDHQFRVLRADSRRIHLLELSLPSARAVAHDADRASFG